MIECSFGASLRGTFYVEADTQSYIYPLHEIASTGKSRNRCVEYVFFK